MAQLRYILYVLNFLLIINAQPCKAQDQPFYSITGYVRGEEGNPIKSATVAVYISSDSSLVAYSLTGQNGLFELNKIPIDKKLRLIVSHISYSKYVLENVHEFRGKAAIDIKLKIRDRIIDPVDVKPPVYMNKDTLEFNADAFKLEPEAVVEDLLRKLPGIMIWGDGEITVNGKKVKNVFVNGKKFFTGDTKIATQNLAKNVIEKVQVYQTKESKNNTRDSSYYMNLVLKKGKSAGIFGKLTIGAGTDKRNEQSGNLNFYNNKTQLSVGGNRNNVNFQPASMDELLKNSTFKGNLIDRLLQTDFNLDGVNKSRMGGVYLQHDFKYHRTEDKDRNQIEVDFFKKSFDNSTTLAINTTDLTEVGVLSYLEKNENQSTNIQNRVGVKYNLKKQDRALLFTLQHRDDKQNSNFFEMQNSVMDEELLSIQKNRSTSGIMNKFSEAKLSVRGFNFESEQVFVRESQSLTSEISSLFEDYSLKSNSLDERHKNARSSTDTYKGNLKIYISDLLKLGNYSDSKGFKFEVNNFWNFRSLNINQEFLDYDTLKNQFVGNPWIDNSRDNKELSLTSSWSVSKKFERNFEGRYKKSIFFKAGINGIYYNSFANGNQHFQNFDIGSSYLKPFLWIYAEDIRYSRYLLSHTLEVERKKKFVDYEQRVFVVDSVGSYNYKISNPFLLNGDLDKITFKTNYVNFNNRALVDQGDFSLDYTHITRPVIDSLVYGSSGKSTTYLINGESGWNASIKLSLKKAVDINSNLLQIHFRNLSDIVSIPTYIGGHKYKTINSSMFFNGGGLFYFKDGKWTIRLDQDVNFYQTVNRGVDERIFKTTDYISTFAMSMQVIKSLTFNASLRYRENSFMGKDNTIITNNLSCNFRFSKNRAEIEILAMDLFNQNKRVINKVVGNSIYTADVNSLNQYFMLSLSYYPRYFFSSKK